MRAETDVLGRMSFFPRRTLSYAIRLNRARALSHSGHRTDSRTSGPSFGRGLLPVAPFVSGSRSLFTAIFCFISLAGHRCRDLARHRIDGKPIIVVPRLCTLLFHGLSHGQSLCFEQSGPLGMDRRFLHLLFSGFNNALMGWRRRAT